MKYKLFQLLGMPTSHGTYPCPFCFASAEDIKVPLVLRVLSVLRTYSKILELYKANKRETGLDRLTQARYYNIIDKPKLDKAPNGMNDDPILHWMVVPFLHVVS